MTPAERAYRLALFAYPAPYRHERGLEILTTILDGSDGPWPRLREVGAVVLDGVARRGRLASGGSRSGSLRAGVRLAAFAWFWIIAVVVSHTALAPYVGPYAGDVHLPAKVLLYLVLLAFVPLLALVRARWYGPLAVYAGWLALDAFGFPGDASWPGDSGGSWRAAASWLLCFTPALACAAARPRPGEPEDRRSLLWLAAAVIAGAAIIWQGLFLTTWLGWPLAIAFAAALLLARRDPRLAVAAACVAALCATERLLLGWQATIWFSSSSLIAPLLIACTCALAWRLRPIGH